VEIDILLIQEGTIVEHWDAADAARMAGQLGINFPSGPEVRSIPLSNAR
jgi:hypothetical protein